MGQLYLTVCSAEEDAAAISTECAAEDRLGMRLHGFGRALNGVLRRSGVVRSLRGVFPDADGSVPCRRDKVIGDGTKAHGADPISRHLGYFVVIVRIVRGARLSRGRRGRRRQGVIGAEAVSKH